MCSSLVSSASDCRLLLLSLSMKKTLLHLCTWIPLCAAKPVVVQYVYNTVAACLLVKCWRRNVVLHLTLFRQNEYSWIGLDFVFIHVGSVAYKMNACCLCIDKESRPCTDPDRPWGFQEAEIHIFEDSQHMNVVKLSVPHTSRFPPPPPAPQSKYSWYWFLLEPDSTPRL
jgi:hypothetical protein